MRNMPYLVAGLSDADMIWLLSRGRLRKLKPGQPLVTAGRPVDDLFFVIGGRLEVRLANGLAVATLAEGDVVGEMSFVERQAPSASVLALDPSELLGIPRQIILDRFEQEPVFAARFYRALAVFLSERLRGTTAAAKPAEPGAEEQAITLATGERFRKLVKMLKR